MSNLPSGPGQTDKNHSQSVVFASDQDPLPVTIGPAAATADGMDNAVTMGVLRARLQVFNGATWDRLRSAITAVSTTLTGFANTLPWALYHAAPVTRTEGQGGPLETDAKGSLRVAEQNPPAYENASDAVASTHDKPVSSVQYNAIATDTVTKANTGTIKAAPGNLYRVYFTNSAATAQVVTLNNKASNPASSDVPVCYFYVPATSTLLVEYKFGKRFTLGIAWAQATAAGGGSITLTGTSDINVSSEFT
jgi:hypothetical protein